MTVCEAEVGMRVVVRDGISSTLCGKTAIVTGYDGLEHVRLVFDEEWPVAPSGVGLWFRRSEIAASTRKETS